MHIQNKRFADVLAYLDKTYNLSANKLSAKLNSVIDGLEITPSKISQYKNYHLKEIPTEIVQALFELYNINPHYLDGTSPNITDNAKVQLEHFKALVKDWGTEEIHYHDKKGDYITEKLLHLTINPRFYKFLLEVNKADAHKKISENLYDIEFEQAKNNYNKNNLKLSRDYVLIPIDGFIDILTDQKELQERLNRILNIDYEKYFNYLDDFNNAD